MQTIRKQYESKSGWVYDTMPRALLQDTEWYKRPVLAGVFLPSFGIAVPSIPCHTNYSKGSGTNGAENRQHDVGSTPGRGRAHTIGLG